jgi:GNAT superfamily N-acetyltransferase
MPDMLVKLYNLQDTDAKLKQIAAAGIEIRRAMSPEKKLIIDWVRQNFEGWVSECEVSFTNHPISCYIAVENGQLLGFGCYDTTCKNFFGPTGVDDKQRGRGIGKGLLLACLEAMKANGYGYAIIGGAGPVDFYEKAAGATVIEGSTPGIYKGILHN